MDFAFLQPIYWIPEAWLRAYHHQQIGASLSSIQHHLLSPISLAPVPLNFAALNYLSFPQTVGQMNCVWNWINLKIYLNWFLHSFNPPFPSFRCVKRSIPFVFVILTRGGRFMAWWKNFLLYFFLGLEEINI